MDCKALTLAAILAATSVAAEIAVPETSVVWRSRATNAIELAVEIEQLYLTLYNSGNLTVRQEEIGTPPPYVEDLLRDQGVMHGAHFPMTLDAMLCDLNPDLCRRVRVPVSSRELNDPVAHVGGFKSSRGAWRLQGGEEVTIPDYEFRSVTTLTRVPAPAGWTSDAFTPEPGMDCSAWKMTCEQVVARFNPRILKAPSGSVTVTVPRLQLETTLSLRPDTTSQLFESLQALRGADTAASDTPRDFNAAGSYSQDWNRVLTRQSPADLTLQTIKENLQPLGAIQMKGVRDEPFVGEQVDLFRIIHHPFADMKDLDESYGRPVDVVVIDAPLSSGHCDLPVLHSPDGTEIAPPMNGEINGCDQINQAAMSDADHAAAVAGVIASPQNGKGTVGLNPNARLWMMALDRNSAADQQILSLIRQIQIDVPQDVRVANLSFGVRPLLANPTEMEQAMDIHGSRLLFVAAAGNERLELSEGNCPILPACLNHLDNVITVVGLDSEMDRPGLWHSQSAGSNSNPKFDIGAPAENVLTTVTGNSFARQKGTSFAAPQVTAAASLIFAAGEFIYGDELAGAQLAPKIVKDRLSYTADFFPGLSAALRDGRLNVERAINVRDAQFELFDGRRVVGQVLEAPSEFVCRTPHRNQQFQKWYNVRRLGWNSAKQRHFLFRHIGDELGGRYGVLERDPSCLVRTLSAPIEVLTRNEDGSSTVVDFHFRDIRDYTSPLFDE
ncbi:S8 family peptidase [Marimonas arenosa]|uniref:S8 family serine peptidase n=1 Tax=Marimonas arenosa TaxID=1795305 RepID=A0AAE4B601_9RHOB|nr:S8 family serine peptidase [Marimonas arenosa]MDQ2090829.1 S8 family serine peptidase [Marimonas arenosa]